MSFFSDLFKGNFGNLGEDLSPKSFFSDFGGDLKKGLKNPIVDVALGAGALALPFLAPELLGGLGGLFGGAEAAGAGAGGALGFAGDVAAGGESAAGFLADPLADVAAGTGAGAGGALPADALALTAPVADVAGTGAAVAAPGSLDALATGVGTGAGTAGSVGAPLDLLAGAGGAAGTSGTAAGAGSLLPSWLTLGNVGKVAGLGGLALTGFEGYQQKKQLNALNAQEQFNAAQAAQTAATENAAAAPLLNQGQTLMSYLTTNTLPPQFQSQVDQTVATMKAGIIQGYATRGMSTDPTKNSGLQQDLAAVDQQALTMKGNFETMLSTAGNQMVQTANQLLASGLSATQLSSEIPIQMAQLDAALNKQMSDALSNFAAALNGGSRIGGNTKSINLNLG